MKLEIGFSFLKIKSSRLFLQWSLIGGIKTELFR